MIRILTFVLIAAALAGCENQGGTGPGGGAGTDGISIGTLDSSDPGTIAYFQTLTGDRVYFEVDQSTLTDEAVATLDAQAEWLMTYQQFTATVEGHADERGTREYNLALGVRRAVAVRDYLINQGVTADRIRTVTYGKERPAETCSNEFCWSVNRRAVTVLEGAATS